MASRFDFVPTRRKRMLLISGVLIVAIKISWAVVRGHQQIEIAVAIKIGVSKSASDFGLAEAVAHFGGYVAKHSMTIIQKQLRRLRVANVATNVAHRVIDVSVRQPPDRAEPSRSSIKK